MLFFNRIHFTFICLWSTKQGHKCSDDKEKFLKGLRRKEHTKLSWKREYWVFRDATYTCLCGQWKDFEAGTLQAKGKCRQNILSQHYGLLTLYAQGALAYFHLIPTNLCTEVLSVITQRSIQTWPGLLGNSEASGWYIFFIFITFNYLLCSHLKHCLFTPQVLRQCGDLH